MSRNRNKTQNRPENKSEQVPTPTPQNTEIAYAENVVNVATFLPQMISVVAEYERENHPIANFILKRMGYEVPKQDAVFLLTQDVVYASIGELAEVVKAVVGAVVVPLQKPVQQTRTPQPIQKKKEDVNPKPKDEGIAEPTNVSSAVIDAAVVANEMR